MVFIYTTCANTLEAENLGKLILDQKIGACVDFWPIHTMYHWEGKMRNHKEVMMLITTFEPKIETVSDLITQNHSYSVPLIGSVDVRRINRPYKEWMTGEVV
jgi:periplasmic divalent cation tolerance protein